MQDILKQGQNKNLTKLNLNYDGVKDGDEQAENYLKIVNEKETRLEWINLGVDAFKTYLHYKTKELTE